jgi:hypothetical protein
MFTSFDVNSDKNIFISILVIWVVEKDFSKIQMFMESSKWQLM